MNGILQRSQDGLDYQLSRKHAFIREQVTFVDGPAGTHRVVFGKDSAVENSYFSAENFYPRMRKGDLR